MRFDDLLSLSRRNLFGTNVIRVPSLFPFKRQQQDPDSDEDGDDSMAAVDGGSRNNLSHALARNQKRGRLLSSRKRRAGGGRQRRDKDADRQRIFINGKKYYVDDDTGELKEVKPASASASAATDTDETYAGNNNAANQRSDVARK